MYQFPKPSTRGHICIQCYEDDLAAEPSSPPTPLLAQYVPDVVWDFHNMWASQQSGNNTVKYHLCVGNISVVHGSCVELKAEHLRMYLQY